MKPTDLHLFRSYGRPALAGDGAVYAALTTPDLAQDRYRGSVHLLRQGRDPVEFTLGPRDSAPVLSPDGTLLVFLRAGESGPAQPYAVRTTGGEPWRLAEHALGVSAVTFAPDGRAIAYLAPVPEPGRYGTERPAPEAPEIADTATETAPDTAADTAPDTTQNTARDASDDAPGSRPQDAASADAEAPRRISVMSYRSDGKGFVLDRPEQIFWLSVTDDAGAPLRDGAPRQLSDEPGPIGRPAFTPDGREVLYARRSAPDSLRGEIAALPVGAVGADGDTPAPTAGRVVAEARGDAALPVAAGDTVYYVGAEYRGNDFAGRTNGLWAVPLAGGAPRRMTDERTVHLDPMAGDPVVVGERVLVAVADRGAVGVRAVGLGADGVTLDEMPVLVGGRRVVRAFDVAGDLLAAVIATPTSAGDLVTVGIGADHRGGGADAPETVLTDVSGTLRESGLGPVIELTGEAPDGYPVHGWLVLPPETAYQAPHPVLLAVHGGPHSAYTWAVFDEAQMYATHGYAVVLPNPRGSAGYGLDHGRAIVGRLGTVDADDVLALLDAALARPDLDAGRVGVMGGSYGGFMTSWLASHAPERFAAGISERAVNAWDSFTGASDIGYFFADGYVGSDRDEQWARSPLAHADRIGIPLLIVHSEHDWRCPLEQAQRLFVALKLRGHETEMLVFPGEGHELSRSGRPQHRRQRFEAILDWWGRYLPVG